MINRFANRNLDINIVISFVKCQFYLVAVLPCFAGVWGLKLVMRNIDRDFMKVV